ncbi:hypothetical protein [Nannocystis punicea]|uniref:Uncharacterized protein n=1 Tax=Nannocystis punicea TaxID=2995304 RepID=A0ABY7HER1_9BACT|nr:hypothetical protein [Nannocystis poenicansa]WAS97768.1 hypothetical protein O0S08_16620 [Nannocystis poenicansa]
MQKFIVTLLALLFSATGCSFTLSSQGGGWGSEGPAPLMAGRGYGWASSADPGRHGRGKPARRVDAAERPATKGSGAAPTRAKQPAITWAGEVPQKPAITWAGEVPPTQAKKPAITWAGEVPAKKEQPAITWAGEVPAKKEQPAITWAGKVPPKQAKKPAAKAKQPAITWAGEVPPARR